MQKRSDRRIDKARFLFAIALAISSSAVFGQAWPTKPVTIVVPFPPGGPSDTAARPILRGTCGYRPRDPTPHTRVGTWRPS